MIRAACLLAIGACTHAGDPGPELMSVTPASAAPAQIVTLAGMRLCGSASDCAQAGGQVQIGLSNPVSAGIVSYADTSAQIVIPSAVPAGPTQLVVTVNDRASNALDFEVLP